jgi:hypothetical protein
LRLDAVQHAECAVILLQDSANGSSSIDPQRLQFAEEKQTENVIQIGAG